MSCCSGGLLCAEGPEVRHSASCGCSATPWCMRLVQGASHPWPAAHCLSFWGKAPDQLVTAVPRACWAAGGPLHPALMREQGAQELHDAGVHVVPRAQEQHGRQGGWASPHPAALQLCGECPAADRRFWAVSAWNDAEACPALTNKQGCRWRCAMAWTS